MENKKPPWFYLIELLVELQQSEDIKPVRKPVYSMLTANQLDLSLPEQGMNFEDFIKKLKRIALATPSSAC